MRIKSSRRAIALFTAICMLVSLPVGCKSDKKGPVPEAKKKAIQKKLAASLADAVNSPHNDFAPIISADGNTLYFTSDRPDGSGGQDIWFSRREGTRWTKARNLAELNTPNDEGLDFFSPDDKAMFFTADLPGGLGKNDIYIRRPTADGWSEPEDLGAPINSEHNDANASLSADGMKLYFVSDRPGGKGGYDIWVSELDASGKWGKPTNIREINTKMWEGNVYVAPDGTTLYFSSNGHLSFGGADVLRSILRDGKWSAPDNLGDKINTTGNETYFAIPASGDMVYMSSTRPGGKGGTDIIAIPLPMIFRPKKIVVVIGDVTDLRNGDPMQAYVKVKYRPTRRDIVSTVTQSSGKFKVTFEPLEKLMLMIYTDDKSVYPYYKPIPIDMEKNSQVIRRYVAMGPDKVPVEKTETEKTP